MRNVDCASRNNGRNRVLVYHLSHSIFKQYNILIERIYLALQFDAVDKIDGHLTQAIKKARGNDLLVKIGYYLTDTPQGCQIIFKEGVLSYDEKKHFNIGTWLYNWQLKQGAKNN